MLLMHKYRKETEPLGTTTINKTIKPIPNLLNQKTDLHP